MELLGIDIGGSGIKGAMVSVKNGEMLTERYRIPTPEGGKPDDIAQIVKQIVEHFDYKGLVGCGFPSIIKNGVCRAHGNLSPNWVGINVESLFKKATGNDFCVINDADAAGLTEIKFGAGKNHEGFVIMITVGTGLGSGAYLNGQLIPNFELGQIPYKEHKKIEHWAANSIRKQEGLSYEEWAVRFNVFLNLVDKLISPDLMIIGGGISKYWNEFEDHLNVKTPVVPAMLKNESGIIGAACGAVIKL